MTVKELASVLNVSERVIQKHASKMGLTENGKRTLLSQEDVTIIKQAIEKSGRTDLANVCEVSNVNTDFEMMQKANDVLSWMKSKMIELEDQNKKLLPKADFYDQVTESDDTIDIATASKILNYDNIGRNKLFAILRSAHVLDKNNTPYQKYVDAEYFRCIESKFTKPDGSTCINIKTVVYQKGLDFIRKIMDKYINGGMKNAQ